MKAKRLIAAAMIVATGLSTTSCYIRFSDQARRDLRRNAVKLVYGKQDSVIFRPGEFSAIENYESIDVKFVQTEDDPRVVILSSTNLLDSVEVNVEDGCLTIGYKDNYTRTGDETAVVYAPALSSIINNGSANFYIEKGLIGDSLNVSTYGSGDIVMRSIEMSSGLVISTMGSGNVMISGLSSPAASISSMGSGDVEASEISTQSILCSTLGSGNIKVEGQNCYVSTASSGSGDITVKGTCDTISALSQGSGNIDLKELKARHFERLDAFGSGEILQGKSGKER